MALVAGGSREPLAPTGQARRGLQGRWWRGSSWEALAPTGRARRGLRCSPPVGLPDWSARFTVYAAAMRTPGSRMGLSRLKRGFAGWLARLLHEGQGCSPLGEAAVNGYRVRWTNKYKFELLNILML